MRNVSNKSCRENQNTFYVQQFFLQNSAASEIMWKNIVEPDRPHMTVWRNSFLCRITRATNTQSEYVILTAVSLHLW